MVPPSVDEVPPMLEAPPLVVVEPPAPAEAPPVEIKMAEVPPVLDVPPVPPLPKATPVMQADQDRLCVSLLGTYKPIELIGVPAVSDVPLLSQHLVLNFEIGMGSPL